MLQQMPGLGRLAGFGRVFHALILRYRLERGKSLASQVEREWKISAAFFGWDSHRAGCVSEIEKARMPPAFRFVGVDGKRVVATPARMGHVIGAAADRPPFQSSTMSNTSGAWEGIIGCRQLAGCQAR